MGVWERWKSETKNSLLLLAYHACQEVGFEGDLRGNKRELGYMQNYILVNRLLYNNPSDASAICRRSCSVYVSNFRILQLELKPAPEYHRAQLPDAPRSLPHVE
jgi:hypothetical protein